MYIAISVSYHPKWGTIWHRIQSQKFLSDFQTMFITRIFIIFLKSIGNYLIDKNKFTIRSIWILSSHVSKQNWWLSSSNEQRCNQWLLRFYSINSNTFSFTTIGPFFHWFYGLSSLEDSLIIGQNEWFHLARRTRRLCRVCDPAMILVTVLMVAL